MRQATQDEQSVWRRLFRRLGAPATNCDCGVFFAGAASEARSGAIRPRRYGVGGLNSGRLEAYRRHHPWPTLGVDDGRSHLGGVEQGLRSQVGVALGHADLGVPKEALDHVKRHCRRVLTSRWRAAINLVLDRIDERISKLEATPCAACTIGSSPSPEA